MELVSILYETSIRSTEEALANLRSGDILKRGQAVNTAVESIVELQRSLRHDVQPEYSKNLAGLYSYMQRRLGEAHGAKSETMFKEVAGLLRTLQEGWNGAIQNLDASTSVSHAVPDVPAGVSAGPYFGDAATVPRPARSWSL